MSPFVEAATGLVQLPSGINMPASVQPAVQVSVEEYSLISLPPSRAVFDAKAVLEMVAVLDNA